MAKQIYEMTLEVVVETDRPDEEVRFGRSLEDGCITIYPKFGEANITECYGYGVNKKLSQEEN